MDQILQQLLDLLLPLFWGALPTVLIVFLLFFFLRWAFWRPFERVLAERQAATEGARKDAETILNTASEKLHQYEEALRHARAEIYREQEAARSAAQEERSRTLRETRQQAAESLRQAKLVVNREVDEAKKELEAESQRLAEQIARTLLAPADASGPDGRRGKTQ
jgi:F0F1-type ATP synthase membrane subunit b/b'